MRVLAFHARSLAWCVAAERQQRLTVERARDV